MSTTLNSAILGLLDHTHPAKARTHRGLTLVPLFAPSPEKPPYISLAGALKLPGFRITEVSSGGSVPELLVVNRTPYNIFLFDGQELRGAKQNRVLNTSILVPADSELPVPVSCTESGRWSYQSPEFTDSKTVMSPKIRKSKSASVSASYLHMQKAVSDQAEVWDEIEDLHACAETSGSSRTRAMKDAYDAHQRRLEEFPKKFPCEPNQSGLLAIRHGHVEGADLLSNPEVYKDLHQSLVESHAMDALVRRDRRENREEPEPGPAAATDAAELGEQFLERARDCQESAHGSPGLGTDHRLTGEAVHGSALVVADTTVHLALFRAENEHRTPLGRASSARQRRARHRRGTDEEL